MNQYRAEPIWKGKTVYIIGGGPSLKDVDLDAYLMDVPVIAANDAFKFKCSDICVFGDVDWFNEHKRELETYPGTVITTKTRCHAEWLHHMSEIGVGLSTRSDALAWNYHTGSLCINLAYLLGAARIVLLGFDMCRRDGEPNWHPNPRPMSDSALNLHITGTQMLADCLKRVAPEVEVYTTQHSALTCWPKVDQELTLEAAQRGGEPILHLEPARVVPTVGISADFDRLSEQLQANFEGELKLIQVETVLDMLPVASGCVTYLGAGVQVTGNLNHILAHDVPFGALLGPEKCPLDTRMVQWNGPQKWFNPVLAARLRYNVDTSMQMWVERARIPWVRLNEHHFGVHCRDEIIEVGL